MSTNGSASDPQRRFVHKVSRTYLNHPRYLSQLVAYNQHSPNETQAFLEQQLPNRIKSPKPRPPLQAIAV